MRNRLKLLVGLVALACLFGLGPSAAGTAEQRRAGDDIRIASYNIIHKVSVSTFGKAVGDLLPLVDIAALQEVRDKSKKAILEDIQKDGIWDVYVPQGEQNTVLWRTSRFSDVSRDLYEISPRWFIGNENPKQGKYIDPKRATVVRLEDQRTKKIFSVINVHLMNGAIQGGKMRPGVPKTYALLVHEIEQLKAIVSKEKARSDQVFVLGDFNIGWVLDSQVRKRELVFRSMKSRGLVANWATEHPRRRGTQQEALLDQIYSEEKALKARVLGLNYSDHRPAYGLYAGR